MKGIAVSLAAAAAHHVTLILAGFVCWPGLVGGMFRRSGRSGSWLDCLQCFPRRDVCYCGRRWNCAVLLPYWMALIQHPIARCPSPTTAGTIMLNSITGQLLCDPLRNPDPGAAIHRGSWLEGSASASSIVWLLGDLSVRPGRTTPLPKLLLGRAFEVLTFERFAFWAVLMAPPSLGC